MEGDAGKAPFFRPLLSVVCEAGAAAKEGTKSGIVGSILAFEQGQSRVSDSISLFRLSLTAKASKSQLSCRAVMLKFGRTRATSWRVFDGACFSDRNSEPRVALYADSCSLLRASELV